MRWTYSAAALALASAALSLYWTAGGTALLDTVGGEIEDLARERSAAAVALGAATVLAKLLAAALALSLARPWGERISRRARLWLSGAAGALLACYGGLLVLVGGLVLLGAIDPGDDVDEHALRWHVFVWDLWFLVWGVALLLAARWFRRRALLNARR